MREFSSHLLYVAGDAVAVSEPAEWQGRVNEARLEDFIVARPELAGERLLILGRQLREFREDVDRLDVLAVDKDGEIVLLELKVDDDFRVTDLQALAYAAAYANQDREHFADALRRWKVKQGETEVTIEAARQEIVDFLGLDDFNAWEPSQHVRIKLIAPGFPKRVLATVKWLGDLYGVRIEAILVRLFEGAADTFQLTFQRVLPLPGAEEFDLTVRERERRKRDENQARRPDVVRFLFEKGYLQEGTKLWLDPSVIPPAARERFDPDSPLFQVTVALSNGAPKFAWLRDAGGAPELLSPSTVPYHMLTALLPGQDFRLYRSVHDKFSKTPGGPTLGQVAEEQGWTRDEPTVAANELGEPQ